MSRILTTAAFGSIALLTLVGLVRRTGDAIDQATLATWLDAVYALLKFAVVCAFTGAVAKRPPARRKSRAPLAFAACAVAITSTFALHPPADGGSTVMLIVGEAIAVIACAWVVASVLSLGTCFGVLPEARGLVTRGPYRLVRHPVYLGEMSAFVGLVVANATPWSVGGLGALLVAQAVRMWMEEQALALEFPEYRDYAARTPRIVPRLGRDEPVAPVAVAGRSA